MLADRNDGYSGLLAVPDLPDRLRRFADRDPLTNLVDHCLGTFFVNITAVQLLPHEAEERAYIGGEAHIVLMKVPSRMGAPLRSVSPLIAICEMCHPLAVFRTVKVVSWFQRRV
jgi:hypothetical protein